MAILKKDIPEQLCYCSGLSFKGEITLVGQNKWDEQILVRAQSNIHKRNATPTNLMEIAAQGGIFTFRKHSDFLL